MKETEIIEAFFKIFSEFTWRKFFGLMVMFAMCFLALSLFERFTSSFRLNRLQKSAELIAKLQELQPVLTNSSPELQKDYQALLAQAGEAIETKPLSFDILPTKLQFSMDSVWKFLAGSAAWYALIVFYLFRGRGNGESGKFEIVKGMLMVGIVSGVFGVWIPPVFWPWFHLFIYPFVFIFTVSMLMLPVIYFLSKRTAK